MALILHRRVADDVRRVRAHYLEEGGPNLGDRFYNEFERILNAIARNPKRFHFVSGELRRVNLPTFPYHLLYRQIATDIRILVLRHNRRHPSFGLKR